MQEGNFCESRKICKYAFTLRLSHRSIHETEIRTPRPMSFIKKAMDPRQAKVRDWYEAARHPRQTASATSIHRGTEYTVCIQGLCESGCNSAETESEPGICSFVFQYIFATMRCIHSPQILRLSSISGPQFCWHVHFFLSC